MTLRRYGPGATLKATRSDWMQAELSLSEIRERGYRDGLTQHYEGPGQGGDGYASFVLDAIGLRGLYRYLHKGDPQ
jgi:hypothetical protein